MEGPDADRSLMEGQDADRYSKRAARRRYQFIGCELAVSLTLRIEVTCPCGASLSWSVVDVVSVIDRVVRVGRQEYD